MSEFYETQVVELTEDVHHLGTRFPQGTHGTIIVAGAAAPQVYLLEIVEEDGATSIELTVSSNQIRPYRESVASRQP